jgi:two-component system chemotaxis family response regulator WspR
LAEFLENAWRAALREQHALSLLMVEVDYFKAYGDAAGIAKSDACIRAVAETISHVAARATDLVARHGGPRFVVVLANTPLEGALQVGEQIRTAVQALSIPRHRPAGVITVSVGVTSTVPTRGTRAETCLAAAERALRAAIERGHNQVGYSSAAHTGLFQSLCLPNDAPRPSS